MRVNESSLDVAEECSQSDVLEVPKVEEDPIPLEVDEEDVTLKPSIFSLSQLTAHCHFSGSWSSVSLTATDLFAAATSVLMHW